jgi:hypothetical protein
MPAETPPAEAPHPPMIINVVAVAEGQQFSPGGPDARILLPLDMLNEAWAAYNGGPETWRTYLQAIEPMLTKAAFERLCRVVPLERAKLPAEPALRLVPAAEPVAPEIEPQEARLLEKLNGMTDEELRDRALRALEAMVEPDDA